MSKTSSSLKSYYKFHSWIYDSTRWTFLFGRKKLHQYIPFESHESFRLLEVGCGTGAVIRHLRKHFPNAHLSGLDLSIDMLQIAQRKIGPDEKVHLVHKAFGSDFKSEGKYDIVLMSYSLSMIKDQWEAIGEAVEEHLSAGGYFILLDFWTSQYQWFRKWMGYHHVYMEAELPQWLSKNFQEHHFQVKEAYLNGWQYMHGVWQLPLS
jgi:S-adenosylmethionine-diacylgycerolhomoserine-N-methlytransferase